MGEREGFCSLTRTKLRSGLGSSAELRLVAPGRSSAAVGRAARIHAGRPQRAGRKQHRSGALREAVTPRVRAAAAAKRGVFCYTWSASVPTPAPVLSSVGCRYSSCCVGCPFPRFLVLGDSRKKTSSSAPGLLCPPSVEILLAALGTGKSKYLHSRRHSRQRFFLCVSV